MGLPYKANGDKYTYTCECGWSVTGPFPDARVLCPHCSIEHYPTAVRCVAGDGIEYTELTDGAEYEYSCSICGDTKIHPKDSYRLKCCGQLKVVTMVKTKDRVMRTKGKYKPFTNEKGEKFLQVIETGELIPRPAKSPPKLPESITVTKLEEKKYRYACSVCGWELILSNPFKRVVCTCYRKPRKPTPPTPRRYLFGDTAKKVFSAFGLTQERVGRWKHAVGLQKLPGGCGSCEKAQESMNRFGRAVYEWRKRRQAKKQATAKANKRRKPSKAGKAPGPGPGSGSPPVVAPGSPPS